MEGGDRATDDAPVSSRPYSVAGDSLQRQSSIRLFDVNELGIVVEFQYPIVVFIRHTGVKLSLAGLSCCLTVVHQVAPVARACHVFVLFCDH